MTKYEKLTSLAEFLAEFEDDDFSFGTWDKTGFRRSPAANRFVRYCIRNGWQISGFDWPSWMKTAAAEKLKDPAVIEQEASADDLAKLLTVAVRQDRFVEGGLNGWFKSGLLTAVMRRAKALADT